MKSTLVIVAEAVGVLALAIGLGYLALFTRAESASIETPRDLDTSNPEQVASNSTSESNKDVGRFRARKNRVKGPENPLPAAKHYQGYRPDLAFNGFTTYAEAGTAKVHLVDMLGNVRHQWLVDAARSRLLPNCNLLVVHGTKWGMRREPWKELRKHIREYSWTGEVVWEYVLDEPAHHDVQRLPNGNTIFLYRIELTAAEQSSVRDPEKRRLRFRSDGIREVTAAGETVWEWRAHEHMDLNSCGRAECPEITPEVRKGEKVYDWTHANTLGIVPENRWYRAGDERFRPGNLIFLPRNWHTVFIIDKRTKAIVWEYQGEYKGGLNGGHEAHMIPEPLPGAGNILLFDNNEEQGASYVIELNPVTQKEAWVYDAGRDFYSRVAGAAQRLPNGNTLISEDVGGRAFEVTPDKQIVWQYEGRGIRTCRSRRYAPDHCERLQELDA